MMSAFIVNDNHVDVIVSYFVTSIMDDKLWYEMNGKYGYMGLEEAEAVANCLMAQNVRSVNSRYNEVNDKFYTFNHIQWAHQTYSVGEIANAISCLEYQSCETDDYHTTDAYKIIQSMRKHLLKQVADADGDETWEISEVKSKFAQFVRSL
jgi:hypothetical protein